MTGLRQESWWCEAAARNHLDHTRLRSLPYEELWDAARLRSADAGRGLAEHAGERGDAGFDLLRIEQILDQALLTLSEAQRQTFVLHAEAGLSYREVAEVMGISIGTVMSRLFYARQKLRSHLAEKLAPQS